MSRLSPAFGLMGIALALQACGGDAGFGGRATTRDSAGVRIVENSGPAWAVGSGWTVEDTPLVDLGGESGEPAYELDQIRGPVLLRDGRIVLFHGAANELRFFDASGKHLLTSGRTGSGPGEYQNVVGLWLTPGDSLLLAEIMLRRLSIVDSGGNYVRSFSLGGQGGQFVPFGGRVDLAGPTGPFGDGSVLGVSQSFTINQARSGVYRDTAIAIRYAADGAVLDTLGRFPGLELEQVSFSIGPQTRSAPTAVPLGKQSVIAVGGERWILAQNNAWELEFRDQAGGLKMLVRAPVQPARLTPLDIAAHRKEQLEVIEGMPMVRNLPAAIKKQMTDRIEQAKYPETLPFFTALLLDPGGYLWAQETTSPAQRSQRWSVVDPAGIWLGTVSMPQDFRPTFVGSDAVYGGWKDPDGVEHVRGHRLRKE